MATASEETWRGRSLPVEKLGYGQRQQRRGENVVVSDARQHGKPSHRPSRTIQACVLLTAAEEPKEFHNMRHANRISVREDEHRGRLDCRRLAGPVVVSN